MDQIILYKSRPMGQIGEGEEMSDSIFGQREIDIWYEQWYHERFKTDVIKPQFEPGLLAIHAFAESMEKELEMIKEYQFYKKGER